ncbi:Palmitoyltransferase [Entamoeba marina]
MDNITRGTSFNFVCTSYIMYAWLWLLGTMIYLNWKDPGYMPKYAPFAVTVKDVYNIHFKDVIAQRKTCDTCHIVRLLRMSHCKYCGHCVNDFDHHCGYLGNCVGRRTKSRFVVFTAMVFLNSFIGFVVMLLELLFEKQELGMLLITIALLFSFFITTMLLMMLSFSHVYLMATQHTTYENIQAHKKVKELYNNWRPRRQQQCRKCENKQTTPIDGHITTNQPGCTNQNEVNVPRDNNQPRITKEQFYYLKNKIETSPYDLGSFTNIINILFKPAPPPFI